MKSTGLTRPVDDLGRITLPKELRCAMGINHNDRLEIFVEGDMICLRKFETGNHLTNLLQKLKAELIKSEIHNHDEVLSAINQIESVVYKDGEQ